ncbi:MAG: hypothetical protein ACE5GE_04345 [Phycisphaerae bacterium]
MATSRTVLAGMMASCALVALTGCADKLTRLHFDMITVGHAEPYDVEQTIGEPSDNLGDIWHYERVDKHLNVLIHFDENTKVSRKEWHDVGNNEHYDSAQPDDSSTYESTRVRTVK